MHEFEMALMGVGEKGIVRGWKDEVDPFGRTVEVYTRLTQKGASAELYTARIASGEWPRAQKTYCFPSLAVANAAAVLRLEAQGDEKECVPHLHINVDNCHIAIPAIPQASNLFSFTMFDPVTTTGQSGVMKSDGVCKRKIVDAYGETIQKFGKDSVRWAGGHYLLGAFINDGMGTDDEMHDYVNEAGEGMEYGLSVRALHRSHRSHLEGYPAWRFLFNDVERKRTTSVEVATPFGLTRLPHNPLKLLEHLMVEESVKKQKKAFSGEKDPFETFFMAQVKVEEDDEDDDN